MTDPELELEDNHGNSHTIILWMEKQNLGGQ